MSRFFHFDFDGKPEERYLTRTDTAKLGSPLFATQLALAKSLLDNAYLSRELRNFLLAMLRVAEAFDIVAVERQLENLLRSPSYVNKRSRATLVQCLDAITVKVPELSFPGDGEDTLATAGEHNLATAIDKLEITPLFSRLRQFYKFGGRCSPQSPLTDALLKAGATWITANERSLRYRVTGTSDPQEFVRLLASALPRDDFNDALAVIDYHKSPSRIKLEANHPCQATEAGTVEIFIHTRANQPADREESAEFGDVSSEMVPKVYWE